MAQSFELSSTYYPGATLHFYSQNPPDEDTLETCDDLDENHIEETYGRLHNCRVHSIWPSPDSSPSISVTLSEPLSVGVREHITQVWRVSATTPSPSLPPLVARIYDPLYCEDPEGLVLPFYPIDCAIYHETKAYELLQPIQGDLVPRFHGLFLCLIPHQERTVYVVLLEYIDGEDLKCLRERGLCKRHKDVITEVVTEVWAQVRSLGVVQCDTKPRNFILRRSVAAEKATSIESSEDKGDIRARVVMIDLEDAAFWEPDEPWDNDARERQLVKNRAGMKGWMDR